MCLLTSFVSSRFLLFFFKVPLKFSIVITFINIDYIWVKQNVFMYKQHQQQLQEQQHHLFYFSQVINVDSMDLIEQT
jgi:hypothetical protein